MRIFRGFIDAIFLILIVFAVLATCQYNAYCPPEQVCSGQQGRPSRPLTNDGCGSDEVCTDDRPDPGSDSDEDSTKTDDRPDPRPDSDDESRNTDDRCDDDGDCSRSDSEDDVSKKPNIVFILLDDVGWNDVGWHNPKFHTPHMNKLASEGVTLTNHYSLAICTPSRSSFLSGYHASRLGMQRGVLQLLEPYGIPTKFKLLPKALKELGYATHALGKWHVGYCDEAYTPMGRGFDTFYGFYNGAEANYDHCNREDVIYSGPQCNLYDFRDGWRKGKRYKGEFSGHLYSRRAVYRINKHDKSQPLFMYVAISHTHFPLQAPRQYCVNCGAYSSPDLKPRFEMCCALAAADSVVANITDALKRRRMYDNTIIVVVSDNGGSYHFGGSNIPYKGNKGTLWEGGSKTPAFVHSPLLKRKGYKNKSLFHITDWYPTFVSAAGGKPDINLEGYDQWPTINANKKTKRHQILYNIDNNGGTMFAAVRKDDWKLVIAPPESQAPLYVIPDKEVTDYSFNVPFLINYTTLEIPYAPSTVKHFLYNLKDDLAEANNLAESSDPVHQAKLKELRDYTFSYYYNLMKPAFKMNNDPAGSPDKDDGWYWVGWCRRYEDVPVKKSYSDKMIEYPR